jgi:hypothetical protein
MVPRMMTPQAGGMIKAWVESKGIQVRTSARVESIDDGPGKASGGGLLGGSPPPSRVAKRIRTPRR